MEMFFNDYSKNTARAKNFAFLLIFWLVPLVAFYLHHRSELEKLNSRIDHLVLSKEDQSNEFHLAGIETTNRVLTDEDNNQQQQSSFTHAINYGVVGDSTADDTSAIQSALDSAGSNESGGTVILPKGNFKTTSPLRIPGGVTLMGQGYGSSPLAIQFDAGASTIAYCGTEHAVIIDGHSSSLQSVAVYDWRYPVGSECDNVKAAGGVLINADGKGIESITMSNIFIYWFMGGTALTLRATSNGAVVFGNYQNIKIRHADVGILIEADETSITNSNSFFDVTIWGGITTAGLIARGPGSNNMNNFYGSVIEPADTKLAHIYVEGSKTNVRIHDIRLEGTEMFALKKPLVIIDDSSYGNVITGMLGHTHVQADFNRNPGIDLMSQKSVGLDPAPLNQYWNAAFKGWDATNKIMPGWKIPENGAITILDSSSSEKLYADHNVVHVDYLNYDGAFKLEADNLPKSPGHSMATFGIYARSSVVGAISAAMRYESGSIISSAEHSGSGDWEFIGMEALYSKSSPYFYFSITNDVDLTAPTFVYGKTPLTPGASLMSSSGAKMSGTLTMGMTTVAPPESGDKWVLPLNEGNIFIMDMEGNADRTIRRISYRTAERFPRGTVVTLLFPEAGTTVANQSYLKLMNGNDFQSTAGSSLTLVANGDPTWIEISRNVLASPSEQFVTIFEENFDNEEGQYQLLNGGKKVVRVSLRDPAYSGGYSLRLKNMQFVDSNNENISNYSTVNIEFKYNSKNMEDDEYFILQSKVDGGGWTEEKRWVKGEDFINDFEWNDASVKVENTSNAIRLQFRIRNQGNESNDAIYIDDLKFSGKLRQNT